MRRVILFAVMLMGASTVALAQSQDLLQHLAAPVYNGDNVAGIDTVDVVVTGNTRLAWIEVEFLHPQLDTVSRATYKRMLTRIAYDCRMETMQVVSVTLASGDTVRSTSDIPAGTAPPSSIEPGTTNWQWLHKICRLPTSAFGAAAAERTPHRSYTVPDQPVWLPVFYNLPDRRLYIDGAHIKRSGTLRTVWVRMAVTHPLPGELIANETFDCAQHRLRLNWSRFIFATAAQDDGPGLEAKPATWDSFPPGSLGAAESRLACHPETAGAPVP